MKQFSWTQLQNKCDDKRLHYKIKYFLFNQIAPKTKQGFDDKLTNIIKQNKKRALKSKNKNGFNKI